MIRFVRWIGLFVVLAAAAVLSFDAIRALALAVSIPEQLAWLLPIAVDAGAAVSCACWLSRDVADDVVRFARIQTWLLLATTVIGNAGHLGMHAHGITPPWWVAVIVGAIPPAVVGGTVHLVVLLGRPDAAADEQKQPPVLERESDAPTPPADSLGGERGIATTSAPTTPDEPVVEPEPANAVATPARPWPAADVSDLVDVAAEWGAAELRAGRTAGKKRIRSQFPGLTEHFADKASAIAKDRATPVDA